MNNEQQTIGNEDNIIVLYNDDGDEVPMEILASHQDNDAVYILAVEGDSSDVLLFKCIEEDDDDTIFELVDDEHEDFDRIFDMFKNDFASLGIEVEDIEL